MESDKVITDLIVSIQMKIGKREEAVASRSHRIKYRQERSMKDVVISQGRGRWSSAIHVHEVELERHRQVAIQI